MQLSILDNLHQNFQSFSKSEKLIANYIIAHSSSVQSMTITTLAEECGVGEATITRFCRKLGFSGYSNLKLSLAKSLTYNSTHAPTLESFGEITQDDSLQSMCLKIYNSENEALLQTLKSIDLDTITSAVDLLSKASQVHCYGQGGSSIIAMMAWGRFITDSSKFHWVQDSHLQAITLALLQPNDVILYFSYSGATGELLEDIVLAKQRGVKIILVTRFSKSPLAKHADVVLLCSCNETPLQIGSIPAKMAQLFLIDVLYNEFSRRHASESLMNKDITIQAVSRKLL